MAIPVYLFCGFLESGKTTFIQETLEDKSFFEGEKTLLLLCEDGEVEYDTAKFAGEVVLETLDNVSQLTLENLLSLQKKHGANRVTIEYNGMWPLESLYDNLPDSWEIFQIITIASSETFVSYLTNIRQLAVDKLQDPEMVLFNRCTDDTDKALLHRSVRMVNRRAMLLFERVDGSLDADDIVDALPFDTDAPVIEIADTDFALWYLDAFDHLEKYCGKTVRFKAYVCQTDRVPKGCFAAGRFAMTCCADDISFIGLICEAKNAKALAHRSWVDVTATVSAKEHAIYEGAGPWLKAIEITPAQPPQEELVYFIAQ